MEYHYNNDTFTQSFSFFPLRAKKMRCETNMHDVQIEKRGDVFPYVCVCVRMCVKMTRDTMNKETWCPHLNRKKRTVTVRTSRTYTYAVQHTLTYVE